MPVYREQLPSVALSRWVECGWFLDSSGAAVGGHRVAPDGCVDIIYDRCEGLSAIGTMTVEKHFHYPQGAFIAGIRFRPGMAGTFLGVAPAELTDSSTALEDLRPRPARELKRQLDDAKSIQDAMRILLGHLPAPDANPTPTQRAIEALT